MITLYGYPGSRAHRVMWLLKELSADWQPLHFQVPRPDGLGLPAMFG